MKRKQYELVGKGMSNSVILPTVIYIKDMDMKCSTAIMNTSSGNEFHERCMLFVKIEEEKYNQI